MAARGSFRMKAKRQLSERPFVAVPLQRELKHSLAIKRDIIYDLNHQSMRLHVDGSMFARLESVSGLEKTSQIVY